MSQQPIDLHLQLISLQQDDQYLLQMRRDAFDDIGVSEPLGERVILKFPLEEADQHLLEPDTYGNWLRQQLFAEAEALAAMRAAVAEIQAKDRPVRLRLDLPPRLQGLFWETLSLDGWGRLAQSERILFSRFLPTGANRPVNLRPPELLQASLAIAQPNDLAAYGLTMPASKAIADQINPFLPHPASCSDQLTLSQLLELMREGRVGAALGVVALNNLLGIGAVWGGWMIASPTDAG